MSQYLKIADTEQILGFPVTTAELDLCVEKIMAILRKDGRGHYFACANPHSFVTAASDEEFRGALLTCDLLIPDGAGIVIASRFLGGTIRTRVTGSDFFHTLNRKLNENGRFSCFFLGSNESTLNLVKKRFHSDYPGIQVAGHHSPPFKDVFSKEDDEIMIKAVNSSGVDLLWVGLGAPKQEKWIYQNKDKLKVKFIGAIGAVFDFYAGNVKRAPVFVQKMGLEWLYRLIQEPRRLWRRNLVSTPKFIMAVLKQKFKGN